MGRSPFAAPYNLYLPQSVLQDGFRQVDAENGGTEGSSCPEPLDRRPNPRSVGVVRRWKSREAQVAGTVFVWLISRVMWKARVRGSGSEIEES